MQERRQRAPRNRTLVCNTQELVRFKKGLLQLDSPVPLSEITNRVIQQDFFLAGPLLPQGFVDLLILDPPYNLSKKFNGSHFRARDANGYRHWFGQILDLLLPTLAPKATIYVCSDWKTSTVVAPLLEEVFRVRNRITWEREKGRGSKSNWKNNTEDIWFCTLSDDYVFNVDAVKLKRRVIAPYRDSQGNPKDWAQGDQGNYRLTHPSNIWTDITIPFWSMPENTNHPTQKPEKLIAKLVLASSNQGDLVLDPFLGSGTTAVVAKKLGRLYCGIEQDVDYCCWAEKRLSQVADDATIQGFADGVFWERNTLNQR